MTRKSSLTIIHAANDTNTVLINFHKHLIAIMRSLSCDYVVAAEVIQIEVLVEDLKDFCGLISAVGVGHVDARVDQVELVVSAPEAAFLHDFFL